LRALKCNGKRIFERLRDEHGCPGGTENASIFATVRGSILNRCGCRRPVQPLHIHRVEVYGLVRDDA
jgi:hypothetical protein